MYHRPHSHKVTFGLNFDASGGQNSTIWPIFMNDKAMGDPESYHANPKHASFAEANEGNCYEGSHIDNVYTRIQISLTKTAMDLGIRNLIVQYMPIYAAFKSTLEITHDDDATKEIQDVLSLIQDNDEQTSPDWNGTDMPTVSSSPTDNTLPANHVGLADNIIEGVDFDADKFRDAINYYSYAKKLLAMTDGGLRTILINQDKPFIMSGWDRVNSGVKAINPYTFCGILFHMPDENSSRQIKETFNPGHTTALINVTVETFFREKNERFDMLPN